MNREYTESDLVFKDETANAVISLYLEYLPEDERKGVRSELNRVFKRAEKEKRAARSTGLDVRALFNKEAGEYILIKPGVYSPQNLLFVLFDILVEHPEGDAEELKADAYNLIDRYIGEIEGREGVNFLGQRENLKQLAGEMIETMCLLDEQEFKEEELEKLSNQIDSTYYEPIGMILQGILIDIEKAPEAKF
ncbi:MAG: hypothetical protein JEY99_12935 [Spirochaetales bacterium]|nr:hypothetical protein [Spirochaetales bacterium]